MADLALGQFPLRRHPQLAVLLDRLDDQALAGLARDGRRPAVAPLEERCAAREAQAALRPVGAVALLALLGEDRPDRLLEELGRGGIVRAGESDERTGWDAGHRQQQGGEAASRSNSPRIEE